MLNSDLCNNLHVIPLPQCYCGFENEDAMHFFLNCPIYAQQRIQLSNSVSQTVDFTLENILFGVPGSSFEQNKIIFDAVHKYIIDTGRFQGWNFDIDILNI